MLGRRGPSQNGGSPKDLDGIGLSCLAVGRKVEAGKTTEAGSVAWNRACVAPNIVKIRALWDRLGPELWATLGSTCVGFRPDVGSLHPN